MSDADPHGYIAGTLTFIRRITWIGAFILLVIVLTLTAETAAQ